MPNSGLQRIIYFGDSQTDGGNLFELTSRLFTRPFPLEEFGYGTNVTNGRNYADVAADQLGVESLNFGFGGASAIGRSPLSVGIDPVLIDAFLVANPDPADLALDQNLIGQVERYLDTLGPGGAPEGEAASIYIGLNDFNNFEPQDPENLIAEATAFIGQVVGAVLAAAGQLAQAGVGTIILNTLPPPSFFPTFKFLPPEIQAAADLIISAFNDALAQQAAPALGPLGVSVEIVDLEAISAEIAADPEAFGFQTVAEQLYFGTAADPILLEGEDGPIPFFATNEAVDGLAPDQFAFFDLFHPTEALHETHGAFAAESLSSETHFGGSPGERIVGTGADDLVLGAGGGDRLVLKGGDDVGLGGLGDDRIRGGEGSDIAAGGAGRDVLLGGAGSDAVLGGAGDDRVFGGADADLLAGGSGSDLVGGAGGDDVFIYADPAFVGADRDGRDLYLGGSGEDTLILLLDAPTRAAVEAELAGQEGGVLKLASIGLTAVSVETVIFADRLDPFAGLEVAGDLAARMEEAELWGFV